MFGPEQSAVAGSQITGGAKWGASGSRIRLERRGEQADLGSAWSGGGKRIYAEDADVWSGTERK